MTTIYINGEEMGRFADIVQALDFSHAITQAGGQLVDLEAWHFNDSRMETYAVADNLMPMIRLMNWPDPNDSEREAARAAFAGNC
ncbi:MAG: hypothetical protein H7319_20565 [Spirosoma sp.]|nr:hypothetical protein [Spirosoma sp.]